MPKKDKDPSEELVQKRRDEITRRIAEKLRARGIDSIDPDEEGSHTDAFFEAWREVLREDFGPDWEKDLVVIDSLIPSRPK